MHRLAIFLIILFLSSCKSPSNNEQKPTTSESDPWTQIFNGKDLEGWSLKIKGHEVNDNFANTFSVHNGIISIRYDGYGDNFDERFGALYFDKVVSDFRLKLDYRFVGETAPGAPPWGYRDSGIQFHGQSSSSMEMDQLFPACLEFNLHGGNGTDDRPTGEICANGMLVEIDGKLNESYCTPPKVKKTFHGDQWVTVEIDVKDNKISHFANGEEILSYANPIYNADHDLGKTFIKDGKIAVTEGYISLQSNSHPIDFRNISLIEY